MNNECIGEIPLEDYLEIVGRSKATEPGQGQLANRGKAAGRVFKMVGLLMLCTLCMAAGDYIRPWTGKETVSYEQALALLTDPKHAAWASEIGMGAAHRHADSVIDAIGGLAMRQADHQTYASSYLRNLSVKGITLLQQLESDGVVPEKVRKDLQYIRRLLGN